MSDLTRKSRRFTKTIAIGESQSDELSIPKEAMVIVIVGDDWTAADIGVMIWSEVANDWVPLNDESGDFLSAAASANNASVMPDKMAAADRIKLLSHSGGTPVAQISGASLEIVLKS